MEQGLQALLDRGASRRKLVLGVAFYGRVYRLASADNTGLHAPIDLLNRPKRGAFLRSDDIHAYFECRELVRQRRLFALLEALTQANVKQ
ncbi:hypothetical protein V5799_008794 [Amblyomma americanum]|uniref:Chitinase n=1 Tax=Amblyomma americanum TaxID=6943 RepID=A0AAQ4FDP6_AMBAM